MPAGQDTPAGQEAPPAQGESGAKGGNGSPKGQEAGKEGVPRTFTQAEVDAIVTQRLARQKAPKDDKAGGARQALNLPEVLKEAQRLAAMKPEEQTQYLQEQQARQALADMEEQRADLARREMRLGAVETLTALQLSPELIACVNLTSADACAESIKALQSVFTAQVEVATDAKVKSLTRGKTPPAGQPDKALDIDLDAIFGVKQKG
jgi:hypothetical protein